MIFPWLLNVVHAAADVSTFFPKSAVITRPHQRAVGLRHFLYRARHVRVVIPHLLPFSTPRQVATAVIVEDQTRGYC